MNAAVCGQGMPGGVSCALSASVLGLTGKTRPKEPVPWSPAVVQSSNGLVSS